MHRILSLVPAVALLGCAVDSPEDVLGEEQALILPACPTPTGCPPPPPPQDTAPPPPRPSAGAEGEYPLWTIRLAVNTAVTDILAELNASPLTTGTTSWRGPQPWDCGYACNSSIRLPTSTIPFAESTTWIKLRYKRFIIQRDIDMPVYIRAYCAGWEFGDGQLVIQVRPQTPIVSGGTLPEAVLSFFTAGHLSEELNNRINGAVSGPGMSVLPLGECTSLGRRSGYPTNAYLDEFVWDVP